MPKKYLEMHDEIMREFEESMERIDKRSIAFMRHFRWVALGLNLIGFAGKLAQPDPFTYAIIPSLVGLSVDIGMFVFLTRSMRKTMGNMARRKLTGKII